jgi:hypothetical protein
MAGHSATDATWEKVTDFKLSYPAIQLEDVMFLGEGGNIMDSFIGKVYQRRRRRNKKPTRVEIELERIVIESDSCHSRSYKSCNELGA